MRFLSYVRTVIQSAETYEMMRSKGIEFATVDSCVAAIMRISCDRDINGKKMSSYRLQCFHMLEADTMIRSFVRNCALLCGKGRV
jgi:hypothetical protein